MYDRVIRADLYQSDRWLDLPSDTHRLVFNALVHEADDFGNLDGGGRRLFRFMHRFCQVKTEADAMKIMSDLADADLVRRYEVDGAEFWHLPRFKNTRRYTSRKYPRSPWCDSEQMSTAEKMRQQNKTAKGQPAADLPQTYRRPAEDLLRGEERGRSGEERSGVVTGVDRQLVLSKDLGLHTSAHSRKTAKREEGFEAFWERYPRKKSKGDALKAWRAIKPDAALVARIVAGIAQAQSGADWQKDGGGFIPYPATWLRAHGWEDEQREAGPTSKTAQSMMALEDLKHGK